MQMPRIPGWKGIDTEEIKAFFLEASAQTYAAGAGKFTVAQLPGSKVLCFHSERSGRTLSYVDCYFSSGRRSFGQTVVSIDNIALWGMQYCGYWEGEEERVIPFLKRALVVAYRAGSFFGGRGPEDYQEEGSGLIYRNYRTRPDGWDFTDFDGYEEIYDRDGKASVSLFRHDYNGLLL